jgi:hypothetical protein
MRLYMTASYICKLVESKAKIFLPLPYRALLLLASFGDFGNIGHIWVWSPPSVHSIVFVKPGNLLSLLGKPAPA